jgi:hypothetical protein
VEERRNAGRLFPASRQVGRDRLDEPACRLARRRADEDRVRLTANEALARAPLEEVALVVDENARDRAQVELSQDLFRGPNVEVSRGVARVDDVEEKIRIRRFFEGGAERGEEILGQIPDEADRVGQDDFAKSLSSVRTLAQVSVLRRVLFPAFV